MRKLVSDVTKYSICIESGHMGVIKESYVKKKHVRWNNYSQIIARMIKSEGSCHR